ncbi:MAG TPA: serpin family protein [Paludibacter sp.]|nr:serpin family protein [Paludibacter sp.]
MKKLTLLLLIVPLVIGCNNQPDVPKNAETLNLRAELQKKVAQDNEFAFDLLGKTINISKESNVFISPLSVSIALGMVWNGANGETKSELETTLKMSGMTMADINEYYRIMQSTLPKLDPATKMMIANSLWYRTGFPVKAEFLKVNSDNFNTYIKELDFSQSWAVDTINNWCAKKTNNLIEKPLDYIPSEAVMYLVNAIYFKGIWQKKFDPRKTAEANFTNEDGSTGKVNMMSIQDTLWYCEDDQAQYLDMPYGNGAFSMTVILPKEGKTTSDVLADLSVAKWQGNLEKLKKQEVLVFLPRFSAKNKYLLNNELQAMGMKLAFGGSADFSSIADDDLLISRVIHNTYIEVTEEGTEAAAVTVVEVANTSLPTYPMFYANKPFLFVIREKSTGIILFAGKMGNVEKY